MTDLSVGVKQHLRDDISPASQQIVCLDWKTEHATSRIFVCAQLNAVELMAYMMDAFRPGRVFRIGRCTPPIDARVENIPAVIDEVLNYFSKSEHVKSVLAP